MLTNTSVARAISKLVKKINVGGNLARFRWLNALTKREYATTSSPRAEKVSSSSEEPKSVNDFVVKTTMNVPSEFREIFPDFMPYPDFERRNPIAEKLERLDMMRRREVLEIPEFYVGSIMAVTLSDKFAPKRSTRFLGICIRREDVGLRHHFTLRNTIDGFGAEIMYNIYNPLVQKIEILKLEKRLDEHLLYLRDALPEYCTFPMDMEPIHHVPGAPVPINPVKVELRPLPWSKQWEKHAELKGIADFWHHLSDRRKYLYTRTVFAPWEKYDVVKQYKTSINQDVQQKVFEDVLEFDQEHAPQRTGSQRSFLTPLKHRFDPVLKAKAEKLLGRRDKLNPALKDA